MTPNGPPLFEALKGGGPYRHRHRFTPYIASRRHRESAPAEGSTVRSRGVNDAPVAPKTEPRDGRDPERRAHDSAPLANRPNGRRTATALHIRRSNVEHRHGARPRINTRIRRSRMTDQPQFSNRSRPPAEPATQTVHPLHGEAGQPAGLRPLPPSTVSRLHGGFTRPPRPWVFRHRELAA